MFYMMEKFNNDILLTLGPGRPGSPPGPGSPGFPMVPCKHRQHCEWRCAPICCVFQSNLITVKLLIMNYVVRHNLHFLHGPLALLDDPSALAVLGLPGEWGNDYRTWQLLNLRWILWCVILDFFLKKKKIFRNWVCMSAGTAVFILAGVAVYYSKYIHFGRLEIIFLQSS